MTSGREIDPENARRMQSTVQRESIPRLSRPGERPTIPESGHEKVHPTVGGQGDGLRHSPARAAVPGGSAVRFRGGSFEVPYMLVMGNDRCAIETYSDEQGRCGWNALAPAAPLP
jgi:hypothetical protein